MADLLKNSELALRLLPELDKLARNVQRRGKAAAFTGHTAFQDELESRIKSMRESFRRDGVGLSGDWQGAGVPGEAFKAASLAGDELHWMLRAGAEEAMEKCAAAGDAATFELCAEAAVALDAAFEIQRYVESGGHAKVAQLGEAGGALAGAALGALAGGGLKYVMSDKAQRKRGLSRLLDAALAGAAAGGLGGWALGRHAEGARKDLSDPAALSGAVLASGKDSEKAVQDARAASESQLAFNNDVIRKSDEFKMLDGHKDDVGAGSRLVRGLHGAAAQELGHIETASQTLRIQRDGIAAAMESLRKSGNSSAAKALAPRLDETDKILHRIDNEVLKTWMPQYSNTPDVITGRDLEDDVNVGGLKALVKGTLGVPKYVIQRTFGHSGDAYEAANVPGRVNASDVHGALRALLAQTERNAQLFGAAPKAR